MILQAGIDLEIANRNVQAIIDFDTGLIGFTEITKHATIEYYYLQSPKEFKIALFEKMESIMAARCSSNLKICRKNERVIKSGEYLTEDK